MPGECCYIQVITFFFPLNRLSEREKNLKMSVWKQIKSTKEIPDCTAGISICKLILSKATFSGNYSIEFVWINTATWDIAQIFFLLQFLLKGTCSNKWKIAFRHVHRISGCFLIVSVNACCRPLILNVWLSPKLHTEDSWCINVCHPFPRGAHSAEWVIKAVKVDSGV